MSQEKHKSGLSCPKCENKLKSLFSYQNYGLSLVKGFCFCENCQTIFKNAFQEV